MEGGDFPEEFGSERRKGGEVGRVGGEALGEGGEEVGDIVLGGEVEGFGRLEGGEETGPGLPGAEEGAFGAEDFEFGEHGAGVVGVNGVGEGVGDAGGEVVGLVDDEEGLGGVEAGLVEKEGAVGGGEDVVEVTDPDIAEREGSAGDFVGADEGGEAGLAEGVEVAGRGDEPVEAGEAALLPTGGEVAEELAVIAEAVEDVVDAVFAFGADVPDGDALGGVDGGRGHHGAEGVEDLELAGGFAGEVEDAGDAAGAEEGEGGGEEGAGFAEAGGGGEEEAGGLVEGVGEVGLDGFLAGAGGGERRVPDEGAEAVAGLAAVIEEGDDLVEAGIDEGVVGVVEKDGLGESAGSLDQDEFAAGGGGRGFEGEEGEVGAKLEEVVGVILAEVGLGAGEGDEGGFDFADEAGGRRGGGEELVDATLEEEEPALAGEAAGEGDLEAGIGMVGGSALTEFVMPVGAELGAPDAAARGGAIGRRAGAGGEGGEVANGETNGALVEVELHQKGGQFRVEGEGLSMLGTWGKIVFSNRYEVNKLGVSRGNTSTRSKLV